jgi:hypothetical protein
MRVWCAAGLAVALFSVPSRVAYAYRPFDGTDAAVAEHGEFELELGPIGFYGQASRHYLIVPATILNYGIFERVELVLQGSGFYRIEPQIAEGRYRVLETGLFLKAVLREGFLQHKEGTSIATEVGPLLPTINDDSRVGGSGAIIVSRQFGDAVVHFNGMVAITQAHNFDAFAGAIIEGPDSLKVRPVTELFVEREFDVAQKYSALVGAIWRAHEKVDCDVGLRIARINDDPVAEVRAGLTWRFP